MRRRRDCGNPSGQRVHRHDAVCGEWVAVRQRLPLRRLHLVMIGCLLHHAVRHNVLPAHLQELVLQIRLIEPYQFQSARAVIDNDLRDGHLRARGDVIHGNDAPVHRDRFARNYLRKGAKVCAILVASWEVHQQVEHGVDVQFGKHLSQSLAHPFDEAHFVIQTPLAGKSGRSRRSRRWCFGG
jgi:hypothetical protein